MRIFIVEKLVIGKSLSTLNILSPGDIIVYTMGLGLWRESKPVISFKDIPFSEPPTEESPNPYIFGPHYHSLAIDLLHSHDLTPILRVGRQFVTLKALNSMMDVIKDALPLCTEIVLIVDTDRRGAYGAGQIIERLPQETRPPTRVLSIYSYLPDAILQALNSTQCQTWETSGFYVLYNEQKIKRLFEYWWHVNSILVFGELCRHAGLIGDPAISKYELMSMFVAKALPLKFSEHVFLDALISHKGSGRYPCSADGSENLGQIGTSTSRSEIIKTMLKRGFLHRHEDRMLSISPQGFLSLDRLSPKSFDQDLPLRLVEWMKHGEVDAVKRYIRTFFGRQLRYQRKQEN